MILSIEIMVLGCFLEYQFCEVKEQLIVYIKEKEEESQYGEFNSLNLGFQVVLIIVISLLLFKYIILS